MHNPKGNSSPLLRISNVTVRFGGLTAVSAVSFDVHQGELMGLIGPNGAGKTTALRSITGVVRAAEGSVLLNGCSIERMSVDQRIRQGLALAQQIVKPFREVSVVDNVALAAGLSKTTSPLIALMHTNRDQELGKAYSMLELVGIAEYADRRPGTLPLGVLKRLEMARALALNPRLLLLDEPLAGLNSKEARALADKIIEINERGVTIVLIEHNLSEVMRICQRLIVLDNGSKIAEGPPSKVMNDPQVRAAYLGKDVLATSVADGVAHA